MRTIFALMWMTTAIAAAAEPRDPKSLEVPAETTAAAKALVAKLADPAIEVRARASADLEAMGRHALPALLAARDGKPNDELRTRLDELIPDARKADFDTRAEVFLADKDRRFDHDLPGWNHLKAATMDTKESRALMADILKDEVCREMLLAAFDTTDGGRTTFETRWEQKQKEWQAVSKAEVRAGIKTIGPWPKADAPAHWMPAALLADLLHAGDYQTSYRHSVVRAYLDMTDEGKLMRVGKGLYAGVVSEFVRYWVARQDGWFGLTDASALSMYMKFEKSVLRATQEKLFELIVTTGKSNASLHQLAGTREPKYIASFRRLFDMDKPYWTPRDDNKLPEIQLRDAGLAMSLALAGQDPTDYGFSTQHKVTMTEALRYDPHNYYFEASNGKTVDDKRKAAFAKWAEWEKANPDKLKAKAPDKKDK